MNNNLIHALRRQPHEKTPIWMMRQAGRYLPEYRALRKEAADFMAFCKTPELVCEAALQPLRRFDLDAAILFSDILTVPQAMGMNLQFVPGLGPRFSQPIRQVADLKALEPGAAMAQLDYVRQAVSTTVAALPLVRDVPLIGFAGSPFTIACYMIEGQGSKTFEQTKAVLYGQPELMHALLTQITAVTIDYLNMQIEAGVSAIQIFDSWGGVLTPTTYQTFSLAYMQTILDAVHKEWAGKKVPRIVFTKGAGSWLPILSHTTADAIGLDWTVDLPQAKSLLSHRFALQGNLDPFCLLGSEQAISDSVKYIMDVMHDVPGFVFNLGHGINQHTPIESVECMINSVRNYERSL